MVKESDDGYYATSIVDSNILTIDNSHAYNITIPDQIRPTDVVIKAADGSVIIEGDLKLGGGAEPLGKRIERIERVLGIGPRQPDLEQEYPDLKVLGDQMDRAIQELNQSIAQTISNIVGAYEDFARECEVMEKLKSENGEKRQRY